MKKIALFVPSLRGGGAERVIVNLSRGLTERGHQVDLVLSKADGPYLADVPGDVRVVDLGVSRVLLSLPRLIRYFRHDRPSVMMSTLGHANMIALWAKKLSGVHCRLIVREANVVYTPSDESHSMRAKLFRLLMRYFYPQADLVIANSGGTARDLERLIRLPAGKLRIIHNPVVTTELFSKASEPFAHPWFGPREPPVLVGVGRLTEQKDFPTLIHAVELVRRHRPVRLIILGEGEARVELENLVAELDLGDSVALPGFVNNPYSYMKNSSLFVLSSKWEGFGNVLVEAMAVGTPVVSVDAPGGPREILEDGQWGRLVPVGDPQALAKAIHEELQNGQRNQAVERAQQFSVDSIVKQYEATLLV